MSHETTKSMLRRLAEHADGGLPWMEILRGDGIDVGCGPDPLHKAKPFDQEDGDANRLSAYFPAGSQDYVHASQVLEHMLDPTDAVLDWLKVLRPGGYLVITVPDWELYEGKRWPSRYNGDHKSTWSMDLRESPCPKHVFVPDWIKTIPAECLRAKLVDTNYDRKIGTSRDQTWKLEDGVEAWVEIVFRKAGRE